MLSLASHSMTTVLSFFVAIGFLVSFHEFGHYLAAVRSGVKVLRFSIGFGPALWKRTFKPGGTEWVIALIPLGGYVKMLDEREGRVDDAELDRAFNRQPLKVRALIVAAGPIANLLLAALLFAIVGVLGMPGLRPFVDTPPSGSALEAAGVNAGDLILAVDQDPIVDWQALRLQIARHVLREDSIELAVEKVSGAHIVAKIPTTLARADKDPVSALGFHAWNPNVPARLGRILPGSAAALQGLMEGDLVLEVDHSPVGGWLDFVQAVRRHPGMPMELTLERSGQRLAVRITPNIAEEDGVRVGKLGAGVALDAALQQKLRVIVRHGPVDAILDGFQKTWQVSVMTLDMMAKMLTGGASTQAIGGPLQIAAAAGESARLGWVPFMGFLAFLSVSLGVLNLLPVPVLDGGHLLYYSFELITGRPVPDRWVELGTRVGMFLLLALMALAFYNDINRFFSG